LARDAFEQAWRDYLPKHTPEDFQAWQAGYSSAQI
jgi:hypothetical protein